MMLFYNFLLFKSNFIRIITIIFFLKKLIIEFDTKLKLKLKLKKMQTNYSKGNLSQME